MSDTLVLCYHAITPDWRSSMAVTPEALEDQITSLLGRGYAPTTFTAAVEHRQRGRTLVVSFDDALSSVETYGLPVLRRLGVPATMFVPTGPVDCGEPARWPGVDRWDGGPDATELDTLNWAELTELAEEGWEIGSHTVTHPHLTQLPDDALADELGRSRETIVERLGACTSIAYPYGDVDDRVVAAAAEAGYRAGAALDRLPGRRSSMREPRAGIYPHDVGRRFAVKTSPVLRRAASMAGRR